ncbi:MAG: quinone oxidoreductase family protein [Caulobacteraceae bacterium]
MKAIRIERTGGPEVLQLLDIETPEPGPGEVRVRHEAIGVNFIDTYMRSGLYPAPLPTGLGAEAAGVVEALGEDVTGFQPGERVGYAMAPLGAYAEAHVVPAARLIRLPDAVSARTAAASLLKGMTSEFLVRRCYPLKAGEVCLVWAAAGGVGQILTQWAKALGARVIGCVGSEAKVETARRNGCEEVILYKSEDVAARVRQFTSGQGVRVSYDGVGKASFEASLKSLGRRGMLVTYGNASGAAPPVAPLELMRGGSLYMTRPTLADYVASREELDASAAALFEVIASGQVKVQIGGEFALADARKAHEALQSGETTGSLLLIP